jgi:hypothetical protein
MAKQQKTNFTHKDSLPQQTSLSDDGGDEISPPPLQGRVTCRSPDGAERNPGLPRRVDAAPDFAPLHPGYDPRHARLVAGLHVFQVRTKPKTDARHKAGHDAFSDHYVLVSRRLFARTRFL